MNSIQFGAVHTRYALRDAEAHSATDIRARLSPWMEKIQDEIPGHDVTVEVTQLEHRPQQVALQVLRGNGRPFEEPIFVEIEPLFINPSAEKTQRMHNMLRQLLPKAAASVGYRFSKGDLEAGYPVSPAALAVAGFDRHA